MEFISSESDSDFYEARLRLLGVKVKVITRQIRMKSKKKAAGQLFTVALEPIDCINQILIILGELLIGWVLP